MMTNPGDMPLSYQILPAVDASKGDDLGSLQDLVDEAGEALLKSMVEAVEAPIAWQTKKISPSFFVGSNRLTQNGLFLAMLVYRSVALLLF